MLTRRVLMTQALLMMGGCALVQSTDSKKLGKLVIGIVAYGEGNNSIERYKRLIEYLEQQLKTLVELEPAYNEVKAVEQIQRRAWSLVFASPGLAAIAISQANYLPIFPLQGVTNLSSVLVVRQNSPIQTLADLNGKSLALGQPGSATGYYVPLYDLYGTILSDIQIASTPEMVLAWVAKGQVAAGALAKNELDQYRSRFPDTSFRVLHTSRRIPAGAILVSPEIERNQQRLIEQALNQAIPAIAQEAGYITNAPPPDFKTLITFINKVKPIESRIQEKPAPLYKPGEKSVRQ